MGGGNDQEGEEELDLDQQLEALDLDANFLDSGFLDDDDEDNKDSQSPPSPPPQQQQEQKLVREDEESTTPQWADRPEIYSRHFKPNPTERQELEGIATKLGVKSGLPKSGGGGFLNPLDGVLGGGGHGNDDESDPHNPQSQWNRLVNGKNSPQTQNLPVSLVLHQGTVMYKDLVDETTGETITQHGCQLILLTRGFLLVKREEKGAGLGGFFGANKKQEIYVPLGSALWTNVRQIQTTAYQSLLITCGGDKTNAVKFDVLPASDFTTWKIALQTAATQAHYNFRSQDDHTERGWQYRLCHTPWFTEAVTGEWGDDVGLEMPFTTTDNDQQQDVVLNQLDDYNSYAPLHYATRANHVDIMRRLLEAGANPNIEDGEGKTPMYYAERDQLPVHTIAVLKEFGAIPSLKAEEEVRGELFGKVNDTNLAREEKRAEAEAAAARAAQEKAMTAQNQMAQNMAAMHKRGEMIEELGDKATDLQDGAQDYANMAAQLKEKMKKKSIWGF